MNFSPCQFSGNVTFKESAKEKKVAIIPRRISR